jgi:hypothetical protein
MLSDRRPAPGRCHIDPVITGTLSHRPGWPARAEIPASPERPSSLPAGPHSRDRQGLQPRRCHTVVVRTTAKPHRRGWPRRTRIPGVTPASRDLPGLRGQPRVTYQVCVASLALEPMLRAAREWPRWDSTGAMDSAGAMDAADEGGHCGVVGHCGRGGTRGCRRNARVEAKSGLDGAAWRCFRKESFLTVPLVRSVSSAGCVGSVRRHL